MGVTSVNQPLIIGIMGSNGKGSTVSFLSSIFNYFGYHPVFIDDKKDLCCIKNMANFENTKQLNIFSKDDIIIIKINEELLKSSDLVNLPFNILIHCRISEDSYESSAEGLERINNLVNSPGFVKTFILNTDDPDWESIISDIENTYLVAYGLGSKATVTASSIEYGREVKFCYCLQRSLTDLKGRVIEPMEFPVTIGAIGQYNVYNCLAAITAALVCGVDADIVKSSFGYSKLGETGVKILFEDGFAIIDNVCDNCLSLETGLEAVQYLPYSNIYLMLDQGVCMIKYKSRLAEILALWSATLRVKSIYYLSGSYGMEVEQYKNILVNSVHNSGTAVKPLEGNLTNVEEIICSLEGRDILLFFCSSKYNHIREGIVDILDKRILGELSRDAE